MSAKVYRFGPFEVDAASHELRRGGLRLRISGRPVQLLLYMIEHREEVILREELRAALWPEGTFVDFEHGLNSAMNKLRQSLGDSSASPRYIETIPRRGYRFIATVEMPVEPKPPRRRAGIAAAALALALIAGGAMLLRSERSTSRAAAHEAYANGRAALSAEDADAMRRAQAYFQRAIALTPQFAEAHSALAVTLNRAALSGAGTPDVLHRQARDAANLALRMDPELAEAYVARATARLRLEWDWSGAEKDLRRAIAIDPQFAAPHQALAHLLAARGDAQQAIQEIATARNLDAMSMTLRRDEAFILYQSRQFDAVIERLAPVVAAQPRNAAARRLLADALLHGQRVEDAKREFLEWLGLAGVGEAEVQRARNDLDRGGFPALYERLANASPKKGHAYKNAVGLAALGRRDDALRALGEAFANRESQLLYLKTDPYLDSLRGDPRFTMLLAQANLSRVPGP